MVREIEPSNLGHQLHGKKKGGLGKGKKENCKKKGNLRMERCGLKAKGRRSAEDHPYLLKT